METKTTLLKSSLIALFLMLFSSMAFAETYYMCSGNTFTMAPATAAPTGMVYRYDVNKDGATVSTNLTTPPTTFSGAGNYEIITKTVIEPANPALCAPASVITNIIVLPTLQLTIGTPSNPAYCGTGTTPTSAITPTASGLPSSTPYTTDLGYEYTYSVSKDGATAVDGTTYGTINATTGVYTLTTTTAGVYVVTGTVKYKYIGAAPSRLLGTAPNLGCPVTSTTQTITVTAAPSAPTITVGS